LVEPKELASCSDEGASIYYPEPISLNGVQPWVILGSSSAKGVGASSYANSWAGLLAEQAPPGVDVVNLAKGGTTTYQALSVSCDVPARRQAYEPDPAANVDAALALGPQWVVVSYPSNDQALGFAPRETINNMEWLVADLQQQGVTVMVLSSQPRVMLEEWKPNLLAVDTALADRLGPCWVDVYSLLEDGGILKPEYDSDGVHLNNAGHEVVFKALWAAVDSGLCVSNP
jgi:lysophospholipase L1-like esterase